jgi:hypothetical protein
VSGTVFASDACWVAHRVTPCTQSLLSFCQPPRRLLMLPACWLSAGIAREYISAGCTAEELRGCVRHLTVFGGYPSCLAATLALQKAKVSSERQNSESEGLWAHVLTRWVGGKAIVQDKTRAVSGKEGRGVRLLSCSSAALDHCTIWPDS